MAEVHKMIKILVSIPTKREPRFSGTINSGRFYRRDPRRVFSRIEKRLCNTHSKGKNRSGVEKVSIYVKYPRSEEYPHGSTNEGKYENYREALYALACFLEDYLPVSFANIKYKKYMTKGGEM